VSRVLDRERIALFEDRKGIILVAMMKLPSPWATSRGTSREKGEGNYDSHFGAWASGKNVRRRRSVQPQCGEMEMPRKIILWGNFLPAIAPIHIVPANGMVRISFRAGVILLAYFRVTDYTDWWRRWVCRAELTSGMLSGYTVFKAAPIITDDP
jgi:hypothetical protein